jgi:hypothetical protein
MRIKFLKIINKLRADYHPCHCNGTIWPGWWLAGCVEIVKKPTGDGI